MYENPFPIWMQGIDGRTILLAAIVIYLWNKARTSGGE